MRNGKREGGRGEEKKVTEKGEGDEVYTTSGREGSNMDEGTGICCFATIRESTYQGADIQG